MGIALDSALGVAAYLVLFGGVGFAFVFLNLLLGRFLRPINPHAEKLEIYECGEPAIGSSFVQFDLRFYVVALVFIIFDVEVAFLFPWATVFGKVTNLRNDPAALVVVENGTPRLAANAAGLYLELGDPSAVAGAPVTRSEAQLRDSAPGQSDFVGLKQIVQFAAVTVSFFFLVLLVGFAYEWRTGALNWVRAVSVAAQPPVQRTISPRLAARGSVLASK